MRRTFVVVATALLLVITVLPNAAAAVPELPELHRVIVQLDPDAAGSRAFSSEVVGRFGGRRGFVFEHALNGFVAELPQGAIDQLARHPAVISITPDRIVASIAAQEPSTGHDRTEADRAPAAPAAGTDCPAGETCTDVDIAVLDTGSNAIADLNVVQRTDCSGVILPGFGSCQNGSGADGNGHGTFVAGVAAAFDNDIGTVGIAPGARIHSVKVLGDDGTGYLSAIIAGVDWVTARADVIDVVNMSLAGEFSDATLNTAIANSVDAGVVYAVAAGNNGTDGQTFSPGSHPDVITVSAIADADGAAGGLSGFTCRDGEIDDTLAGFSNYGAVVDIAAPGVCITSVWNDGSMHVGSGTSAASPMVAGAAARYIAIHGRDVTGDSAIDGSDVDAVKAALLADGHPQGTACGFTGDPDGIPEPLLFVNGPAFGGDGSCDIEQPDLTPPSAPGALTATALGFPVDLSWTAADDPDTGVLEYRIYRDTVPSTGELALATVDAGTTTYTDDETAGGTTYRYEVSAVNLQFGEGARSNPAEAATVNADPTDAGWWAFDDGTGTTAVDSTAWQRPGTLVNGPAWTAAGKVAGAVDLDGLDDRIDLDAAVLDGYGDVTFAAWIKTTKTGQQALLSAANGSNSNEFLVMLVDDTTLRFFTGWSGSAGVQWSMDSVADGQWHHLAVVRDDTADRATAYRDGASLGTWGLTEPMDVLDVEALLIGQDQDSVGGGFQSTQAFDGVLDEVRVYTRILGQADIDALALRDTTPPTAPPTLTAVAAGSHVDLTWGSASDAESGITSYEIWRGSGVGVGTPTTLWATVPGTQTGYRDTAVQPATPYVYEVVAVNGGGIAGPASPEAAVTTNDGDTTLRGWWALDDGVGTAALDWSTYAQHGTLAGDPVWTAGTSGGALTFDGVGDLVDLPASALDGADDVTLALWFRTTKDGIQAMVSGANAGNDAEIELIPVSATTIRFYTGEATTSYVSWTVPSISDGAWHHIAVTRDGVNDQATLYLDGTSYGARAKTITALSIDTNGLVLGQEQDSVGGGYSSTQAFVGSMDEVRFYDRVLGAAEIADLAGLGVPVPDTTPPGAPVGVSASAGDGEVVLGWDDNVEPDLASYTVYRGDASGGPYGVVAAGVTSSGFVDSSVVNGVTYFYVVSATDSVGNESAVSVEVSATPAAPVAAYGDLVVGDGAYAWWRLGEASGTTAFDAIGTHDATYRNGVSLGVGGLLEGDPDTAAAFDGANDYVAVPDASDINTGGPYTARTVELWFNADDVTSRQVLYEEGGTTRGIAVYIDDGRLYFSVWNRRNDDGSGGWGPVWVATPVVTGETYHAVLVFDATAGTLEGYVNGDGVGAQSGARALYRHTANVGIGAMNGATYFHDGGANATGYYFDGVIDEVALYAEPLTATQVHAHWLAGAG